MLLEDHSQMTAGEICRLELRSRSVSLGQCEASAGAKRIVTIRHAHIGAPQGDINRLIADRYHSRGLTADAALVKAQAAAGLLTLAAVVGQAPDPRTIGTMTLRIEVGETRLHCEGTYPEEVVQQRASGRLCEITGLAAESEHLSFPLMGAMFHTAFLYAKSFDAAVCLIEVHPRKASFYQQCLGFVQVGPERICERAKAPAVLLRLDLAWMEGQIRRFKAPGAPIGRSRLLYQYFFSNMEVEGISRRLFANNGRH